MNLHNSSGLNECFYFFSGLSNLFTISITVFCVTSSEELKTTGRFRNFSQILGLGRLKKVATARFFCFNPSRPDSGREEKLKCLFSQF